MAIFLKTVRICIGCVFILSGFIGVGVGIIGIIDPVGTKMSDDGDPFGVPPPFSEALVMTCVFALVFIVGIWLVSGFKIKRNLS